MGIKSRPKPRALTSPVASKRVLAKRPSDPAATMAAMTSTGSSARRATDKCTLGIDEAGRGPVLGPMVLAAVAVDSRGARALTRAGLTDSKSYGSGKKAHAIRMALADAVREHAVFWSVQVVDVEEIDRRVRLSELNLLEREVAERMIKAAPEVDRIVCDGERLFSPLRSRYPHLEAVNKGESAHASVAAASVLAKTRRDELFALMQERYRGEFGAFEGGGYVNAATKAFLVRYATRYRRLPIEARRSWPYDYLKGLLDEPAPTPKKSSQKSDPGQLALF